MENNIKNSKKINEVLDLISILLDRIKDVEKDVNYLKSIAKLSEIKDSIDGK